MKKCNIEDLKGKVLALIKGKVDDEELIFITKEEEVYKMYHEQDCCEDVRISEIIGDLGDLLWRPILLAEEVSHDNDDDNTPPGKSDDGDDNDDSYTWTFYKLSTIKGSVTIRWYGSSNGYYSESVDFVKLGGK